MKKIGIALTFFVVMTLAVPTAYAIAYNGSVSVSSASSDCLCLTVEPCVLKDGEYVSSHIITEKAGITKNGSIYTLSATSVQLSPDNLYMKISAIGYDGDIKVSCETSVVGVGSCTAVIDDTVLDTEVSVSQGYHPFKVFYTGSYSGSSMPQSEITVTVYATLLCNGSAVTEGSAVRLKATSNATALELLEDSNPDLDSDYNLSTNTSINHGSNYPATNISNDKNNQGGISDNQGKIDVEIHIPSGPSFVLYLRTTGNNTFTLTMTRGTETLVSGTVTFNSGWGATGYYLSSVSADGTSSGYFYTSLTAVTNANAWMTGNGDEIDIVIHTEDGESASKSLKMDIVFIKE